MERLSSGSKKILDWFEPTKIGLQWNYPSLQLLYCTIHYNGTILGFCKAGLGTLKQIPSSEGPWLAAWMKTSANTLLSNKTSKFI
jgi:hypothetical protein